LNKNETFKSPHPVSTIFFNVIHFVVYSNIFIALSTAAYTAETSLLLYGNNGNVHVNTIAFCATLLFYCFHRINKKKFLIPDENQEERHDWMNAHKSIYYILILISLILLSVQLFYMPLKTGLVFIPVGLLGLGYTFPVIPSGNGWKRLRDIYWLKTLWVAIAFSWLTTFLPVAFSAPLSSMLKPEALFIFGRNLLFVFAICIPFDIRDMNFDKLKGVPTVPVSVGIKTSIYIAIILLLFFISIVCIQFLYFGLDIRVAAALFLSAVLTIILLPLAKVKRPALLYPLLYDGAMLVQWILVFAFMRF